MADLKFDHRYLPKLKLNVYLFLKGLGYRVLSVLRWIPEAPRKTEKRDVVISFHYQDNNLSHQPSSL